MSRVQDRLWRMTTARPVNDGRPGRCVREDFDKALELTLVAASTGNQPNRNK
jgi:hypothetical protein